ncbi:hypothetical protein ACJX0J_028847 [Zea mays]
MNTPTLKKINFERCFWGLYGAVDFFDIIMEYVKPCILVINNFLPNNHVDFASKFDGTSDHDGTAEEVQGDTFAYGPKHFENFYVHQPKHVNYYDVITVTSVILYEMYSADAWADCSTSEAVGARAFLNYLRFLNKKIRVGVMQVLEVLQVVAQAFRRRKKENADTMPNNSAYLLETSFFFFF